MKGAYILILLVFAASALGCVGKKEAETQAPVSPIAIPVSTAPSGTEDLFGTESDLTAIDSMFNDSDLDISLSESI